MNILISGGWSYGNIGDEVIASSTIYLCDKFFKDDTKTYTAYDVSDFRKEHQIDAVPSIHKLICDNHFEDALLEEIMNSGVWDAYLDRIDENSIFIMSGGGYWGGNWRSQMMARFTEILLAKKKNAKVIVIGQSIGPIYEEYQENFRKVFALIDYITVRDTSSAQYLKKLVGKEIPIYPDLAVVISDYYHKCQNENVINIMPAAYTEYTSIHEKKNRSKLMLKLNRHFSIGAIIYRQTYKKLIRYLSNECNYKVQFVMSTNWAWDEEFLQKLIREIDGDNYAVHRNCDAKQLSEVLSTGNMVISSKMHPIIISTSYGIPSIGISYNYKVDNFMDYIGRSYFCNNVDHFYYKTAINQVRRCLSEGWVDPNEQKKKVYDLFELILEFLKHCK